MQLNNIFIICFDTQLLVFGKVCLFVYFFINRCPKIPTVLSTIIFGFKYFL
jgi:hypothetical protein